jgi:hypothetical protein
MPRSARLHTEKRGILPLTLAVLCSCGGPEKVQAPASQAISEKVLAARKLQQPLDTHLCQAAVYPTSAAEWQVTRVQVLSGRGKTFQAALEALCREADGLRLPAVTDITYVRLPGGWADAHELRGMGIRYESGFVPPPPPPFQSIPPPEMQMPAQEPPPSGEPPSSSSSSSSS